MVADALYIELLSHDNCTSLEILTRTKAINAIIWNQYEWQYVCSQEGACMGEYKMKTSHRRAT